MVNKLPAVGRIQGVQLEKQDAPEAGKIRLQYTTSAGEWHEVEIPFLDGMYLLNLLKALQREADFKMPED